MVRRLRWIGPVAAVVVLPAVAYPQAHIVERKASLSPFLRRANALREGYTNFAVHPAQPYNANIALNKLYDDFGNYQTTGYPVVVMEERRPGPARLSARRGDGSYSYRDQQIYRNWFGWMMIGDDIYKGMSFHLTGGEQIRTKFTPLTLNLPVFSGLRLDAATTKNRFTMLYTRGYSMYRNDRVNLLSLFSVPTRLDVAGNRILTMEESPVPMMGAHWETDIGDAVTLGATFINQHQENVRQDRGVNTLRGTMPYDILPPTRVVLTFTDDSPLDGIGGAAVFEVNVKVIGEDGSEFTRFVPLILGGRRVGDHIEANGFDEVSYAYDMPLSPLPVAMEVEAVVANDYNIKIGQEHKFFNPRSKQVDKEGNPLEFEDRTTEPRTIDRAEGNIRDLSNKRRIRFRYGFFTGQQLYGMNFRGDFTGVKVGGEFAVTSTYQQFPTVRGEQLSPQRGSAWYLTALKELGSFSVGAEVFHVGPDYGSYVGSRGGVTLSTDKSGPSRQLAVTTEFPWVADNDDKDMWTDDDPAEVHGPTAIDLTSGNFPGRDEDQDGHIDDDRNSNQIPDWTEPFLLYYSDPIEFAYGYDWNNNGWTDQWEDDEKADFPYDKDTEGNHLFVELSPHRMLKLAVGRLDKEELARGGENLTQYFRSQFTWELPQVFGIEWYHDSKRVRDDVRNSVYTFGEFTNPAGPQPDDAGFDTLQMRNSLAHTAFLGARYHHILNLHIENNFRFFQNHQLGSAFDDGTAQPDVRRNVFTMVNRADYTFRFGRWTLMPQYKLLTLIETENPKGSPSLVRRSQAYSAPILKVDYALSKRTTVRFGQQGFRFGFADVFANRNALAFRFRDRTNPRASFARSDTVLMLQTASGYLGRTVWASIGIHRSNVEFDSEERELRSDRFSRLFVELVSGY